MDDAARTNVEQADAVDRLEKGDADGDAVARGTAAAERERQWRSENREAIACYNRWIETHGVPLEEFRAF